MAKRKTHIASPTDGQSFRDSFERSIAEALDHRCNWLVMTWQNIVMKFPVTASEESVWEYYKMRSMYIRRLQALDELEDSMRRFRRKYWHND